MSEQLPESVRRLVGPLLSGTRIGQFASVGVAGAVVDTLALYVLVEFGGAGPVLAKVIAWEVAIVFIFSVNERWTFSGFGQRGLVALGRRFLQSNLVRVGGFAVTMAVYVALIELAGVWYIAANVIGICVGFLVNYTFESLWTWSVHR